MLTQPLIKAEEHILATTCNNAPASGLTLLFRQLTKFVWSGHHELLAEACPLIPYEGGVRQPVSSIIDGRRTSGTYYIHDNGYKLMTQGVYFFIDAGGEIYRCGSYDNTLEGFKERRRRRSPAYATNP